MELILIVGLIMGIGVGGVTAGVLADQEAKAKPKKKYELTMNEHGGWVKREVTK